MSDAESRLGDLSALVDTKADEHEVELLRIEIEKSQKVSHTVSVVVQVV